MTTGKEPIRLDLLREPASEEVRDPHGNADEESFRHYMERYLEAFEEGIE